MAIFETASIQIFRISLSLWANYLHNSVNRMISAPLHEHNRIHLWRWLRKYCSFVYKHPYVPLITSFVTFAAFAIWLLCEYGVSPYGDVNYYRWSGDEISNRWDAYVGAGRGTYSSLMDLVGRSVAMPAQTQMTQMSAVIWERENGANMLTAEAVRVVWRLEEEMHATPGWSDYCAKLPMDGMPEFIQDMVMNVADLFKDLLSDIEPKTYCVDFKSIATDCRMYMKGLPELNGREPQPEDLTDEMLRTFVLNTSRTEVIVGTYMGSDWNEEKFFSNRLRTLITFGLPIEGYRNKVDRQREQELKLGKWQAEFAKPIIAGQEAKTDGCIPYSCFPFAVTYQLTGTVIKQFLWVGASFAVLFVFSGVVTRTVFVSLMGTIGVFMAIPCALLVLHAVVGVMHFDLTFIVSLFLVCGTGADCMFVLFRLMKYGKDCYPKNNKRRLAYAVQRGFMTLTTSICTSGVMCLALCVCPMRIVSFFGIFTFIVLFFMYVFTFTWYVAVIAIWARWLENKRDKKFTIMNLESVSAQSLFIEDENVYTETPVASDTSESQATQNYPLLGILDFLKHKPVFNIDSAGMHTDGFNSYEAFFYNYITPITFFYRLPIILVFFIVTVVFGVFGLQIPTKTGIEFFPDTDPCQRGLSILLDKFQTPLNDVSLTYVWGVEETPVNSFGDRFTVDQYGAAEFRPFNITDPGVQKHIDWVYNLTFEQDWIHTKGSDKLSSHPWRYWDNMTMVNYIEHPLIRLILDILFVEMNFTAPPTDYPITEEQYKGWQFVWQGLLSQYTFTEPEPYIVGAKKGSAAGFSLYDYSLQHIGIKMNMEMPEKVNAKSLRVLYEKAQLFERYVESTAIQNKLNFTGYMTSALWLTMVAEEKLRNQIIESMALSFGCAAIAVLCATWSFLDGLLICYCMISTVLIMAGIVSFNQGEMGINEAMIVPIATGFCAHFILQPMLSLSHDYSKRCLYGKIQASLTTFCTPVSFALIGMIVSACFLYTSKVMLFPPFASFVIGNAILSILQGVFVLPALIAMFSLNKSAAEPSRIHVMLPSGPVEDDSDSSTDGT